MIQVEEILSKEESQQLEFKAMLNLDDEHYKKEIAKDFIAMANAKGGKIIIGYDEKTKNVFGVPKEWKEERFQQIISKRSDPPVLFQTQFTYYQGKILAIFTIPESKLKPHSDPERNVWIRRGTIIDKAHPREILNMSYSRSAVRSGKVSRKLVKDRDEKRGRVDFETQAGIFEIPHGRTAYRSSKLFGEFADGAHFSVFLPSFDFYRPAPEFGDTKSVLLLENDISIFDYSVRAFRLLLKLLEIIPLRLSPKYALWDVSRLYWSFKVNENIAYGIGAQQAIQAIKDYGFGIFNGVIQFGFGDIYNSTCFLHICFEVNEIREKKLHVRDIELRLMLSTIPTDWELVHNLFRSISPLMKLGKAQSKFYPTQPEACTLRKIGYIVWRPKERPRLPFQPIATIGRESSSDKPEYDLSQGVIVKGSVFQNVDYKVDEENSWMADWYGGIFKQPPIRCFEEIPVTITNSVPAWDDLVKNVYSQISPPRIRQVIFGALGGLVSILNFHGSWSLFVKEMSSRK